LIEASASNWGLNLGCASNLFAAGHALSCGFLFWLRHWSRRLRNPTEKLNPSGLGFIIGLAGEVVTNNPVVATVGKVGDTLAILHASLVGRVRTIHTQDAAAECAHGAALRVEFRCG